MGEARKKDLAARDLAFSRTERCIFCGGGQMGATVDHCPPRAIFFKRQAPEGYVFPACVRCNAGSRTAENWIALLARINSGADIEAHEDGRELARIAKPLLKPHILESMRLTANRKRALARRSGFRPAPGETYGDLPLMGIPPEASAAVEEFAPKLAKALHFLHTGRIVPLEAAIKNRWFTNFNQAEGTIPNEIFTIPSGVVPLRRANVDLGNQFNYRYAVADTGDFSMFTVWFRQSFCVVMILTFDPRLLAQLEADEGIAMPDEAAEHRGMTGAVNPLQ